MIDANQMETYDVQHLSEEDGERGGEGREKKVFGEKEYS